MGMSGRVGALGVAECIIAPRPSAAARLLDPVKTKVKSSAVSIAGYFELRCPRLSELVSLPQADEIFPLHGRFVTPLPWLAVITCCTNFRLLIFIGRAMPNPFWRSTKGGR